MRCWSRRRRPISRRTCWHLPPANPAGVVDADLDELALMHLSKSFPAKQAETYLKDGIPKSTAERIKGDARILLGNVYIYVRTKKFDICPELEESVQQQVLLDNRDCIFMPHCTKIWYPKQEYHIVNSDPVAQNVAFSPLGDAPANIVLPPPPDKAAEATWKFNRKQRLPVPIACNYHPWESACVLPMDHPYVDITKMDGTFRISKLPVGELEFQVWQERVGYLATPEWKKGRFKMTVKPGINDLGTIKIDAALLAK